ncbi:MAG: hypothetical protein OEM29_00470 [Thermoplasmata archaeon]|nr:hypothetical protein [Thermoplasmata archaeon]
MPWTGEDTKDVFKKVLGGLIAAAVIAIIYAVMEPKPWYLLTFLGVGLFVLVLLLAWRLIAARVTDEEASEPSARDSQLSVAYEKPVDSAEKRPAPQAPPSELPRVKEPDSKAVKKKAKAEEKRLKKEAKAEQKGRD